MPNPKSLRHGGYSDGLLPGENPEALDALSKGVRLDLEPQGALQEELASELAMMLLRKRRINHLLQRELADAEFAQDEKSAKQHGRAISRSLMSNHTDADVQLTDAITSVSDLLDTSDSGKLGSNVRGLLSAIEKLRPIIEAGLRSLDEVKQIHRSHNLDRIRLLCELDARSDGQIDKKLHRMVALKEYQRLYGRNSNIKLISQERAAANKETVTQVSVPSKKQTDTNDNWNENDDDDDNDNDNQINPNDYDWEEEYVEDLAEQEKARRRRGAQQD